MKIGVFEILLIIIVALVLIGPDEFPKVLGKLGKALRDIKKASSELSNEIRDIAEPINELKKPLDEAVKPVYELKDSLNASLNSVGNDIKNIANLDEIKSTTKSDNVSSNKTDIE